MKLLLVRLVQGIIHKDYYLSIQVLACFQMKTNTTILDY